MSKETSFCMVIPCYNEEKRIPKTIEEMLNFRKTHQFNELIFVNDGSTDSTLSILEDIKKKYAFVKIISYQKNLGKGYAVRQGILNSNSDYILVTDVDLSTPLNDFLKLKKYINDYNIIIGSRRAINADVTKKQNPIKVLLGEIGNKLIKLFLGLKIDDTQCGFKLFSKKSKEIFRKAKINRFGWDFEILFLANKLGYKIKEVGVHWENDKLSKVRPSDYFKTLNELFKVKINWWKHKY